MQPEPVDHRTGSILWSVMLDNFGPVNVSAFVCKHEWLLTFEPVMLTTRSASESACTLISCASHLLWAMNNNMQRSYQSESSNYFFLLCIHINTIDILMKWWILDYTQINRHFIEQRKRGRLPLITRNLLLFEAFAKIVAVFGWQIGKSRNYQLPAGRFLISSNKLSINLQEYWIMIWMHVCYSGEADFPFWQPTHYDVKFFVLHFVCKWSTCSAWLGIFAIAAISIFRLFLLLPEGY